MKNGKFNMGRIHYFDPNVVSFENHEGTNSDSISYPLEDYSVAIDLLVRVYNRYSCGFGEVTNEFKDYRYSTNDGSLSFLGGTDGFLTTNFTDISLTQPEGNTTECLGIESINIEYQTFLHPVVNIKFVDVRGGTVMQPAENNYYDESKRGRSYQLYKAFFSMPYPLFILKVKGFYGKGISYRLTISKVDIEFDSSSGNFVFNVDFIGHLYGIFADLPMTYIAIAPYMENGREYWEKKISEGVFCFYGSDGNGGEVKQCDMMTFPKLALKLNQVAMSQPILENEANSQKAMQDIDEEYASLNAILESYPFKDSKFLYEDTSQGSEQMAYQVVFEENGPDFWESVVNFSDAISGYSGTYYEGLNTKFGDLGEFCKKNDGGGARINKHIETYKLSVTNRANGEFDNSKFNKANSFLKDVIAERIKNEPGVTDGKTFYVYVYTKGTTNQYHGIMEELAQRSQKLSDKRPDVEAEFKKERNVLIEKALGFKPSIRNIYNLAFAHLDTFMEVEYSMLKKIKEQLDTHQPQRKKESFEELKEDGGKYDTDTESMFLKTSNGDTANVRAQYLPPFTAYYRDVYDSSTSFYEDYNKGKTKNENYFDRGENKASKRKELIWPGELSKGEEYLLETKLVNELLTAAKLYLKEAELVKEEIEKLKASGGTYTTNGTSPSTSTGAFIPLTTFDLANNGKYSNPYSYLNGRISNNSVGIEGDILFTFALRAFYYMNVNDDSRQEAKSFGRMEAVNLFKAVGDEVINSKPFIEFIAKYGDEKGESGEKSDFISYITGEKTKEGITDTWIYGDKKSLFEKKGSKLVFNYIHGGSGNDYHLLPIGAQEPNLVKSDDSGMNCMNYRDCRYISTDDHKKFCSDKDADTGSFVLIEERDYLRTLISNFDAEVTNVEEILKDRDKEKGNEYGSRGVYDYGELFRDKSAISHYRDNVNTGEERVRRLSKKMFEYSGGTASGKDIAEEMANGDMEEFYVKRPTRINGIGENRGTDSSLYDLPLYWLQDNNEARAYLFMLSIPLIGKNLGIEEKSENGAVPKISLLREGAFYWWEENYDSEKVKVSGTVFGKKYNYKKPGRDESFIRNTIEIGSDMETILPLKQNELGRYEKNRKPINATLSRRKYLIKYFEDWANSEYSENEKYLTDTKLYIDGKYKNGLNNSYLKNNIVSSSDDVADKSYKLQNFLKNTLTSMCTTFDYYNGCYSEKGNTELSCGVSDMRKALNGFMEELNVIYGDMAKDIKEDNGDIAEAIYNANAQDPFRNKDLKLSTYMTLKSLYDKWICGSYKGEKTWRFNKTNMWEPQYKDSGYELDHFLYCDNFFHDIGYNLTVNLTKIVEWINECLPTSEVNTTEGVMHVTGKTIYEFLTDVAQDCGGYLLAVPQRFIYSNPGSIEEAFKPFPTCQDWDDDTSTYMFLYTYKPSEHLGDSGENGDNTSIDMNGWSPDGDGFDLTNEDIVGELFCDNGFEVPAFGVTFAKQNQAYFKDIKLSTATHGVTEVGLNATFNIVSKASESPRETTLYGQDIYKVYSNNSYQCTVEMMGNMQIFPPMYFQLNNIPLWKGAYLIQKVTHSIKPGDVTTTIVGYRQNKYAIPMSDAEITVDMNSRSTEVEDTTNTDANTSTLSIGGIGGESYNEKNIKANPNKRLQYSDESDYNPTNITPQKPLICFTPAHSTVNGTIRKATENAWSAKLIDNYIIPKLRQKKFKDGTSYSNNIHRCKTSNNPSGGYSLKETKELIEKYGSDCVISIVPHWNGLPAKCNGKTNTTGYFAVFYGKSFNGTPWKLRRDAAIFGEYARAACQKLVDNRKSLKKLPIEKLPKSKDMINYVKQEKDGMFCYLLPATNKENDKSDPGVGLDCAHILTENFFPEYTSDMTTKWTSPDFDKQDENGRYVTGRGWLESNEGCDSIADVHVNAIVNYINSIGTNQSVLASNGKSGYVSPGAPSGPIEGKTNTGLVAYCRAQLGNPYWWGGYGSRSTTSLLAWYRKTYPDQYSYTREPKYETQMGKKVHDCVGLIKGYMWSNSPTDPSPKYNGNEFKDCTADGLLNRSTVKGPISTIPEVPGLAVYMPGHVGVYIGGGKVIEAKGHAYGVVETELKGRGWKNWSYIDGIKYV